MIDPIARFEESFARAVAAEPKLPDAVTLATADRAGRPSARVVLLKGVEDGAFVFYTNYESRKGHELAANPYAALCFYWKSLDEQIRVEGPVEKTSAAASATYFRSRPKLSQIAALASEQSRALSSRAALERRFESLRSQYADDPVPCPAHWGGYRLAPQRIEFWVNGEHRLHHRDLYEREGERWTHRILNP